MSVAQGRLPLGMLLSLAWRNLWRHRRRTLITLSSITLGFALAVLFIGIGDGSHNSMIRNAINMGEGHLAIQPRGYQEAPANHKYLADGKALVERFTGLKLAGRIEPRISLRVLASTASNSVGAALEGMGDAADPRADLLKLKLVDGRWLESGDERGVVIGAGMARKLKAKVGSWDRRPVPPNSPGACRCWGQWLGLIQGMLPRATGRLAPINRASA